jgi:hypothetical protein
VCPPEGTVGLQSFFGFLVWSYDLVLTYVFPPWYNSQEGFTNAEAQHHCHALELQNAELHKCVFFIKLACFRYFVNRNKRWTKTPTNSSVLPRAYRIENKKSYSFTYVKIHARKKSSTEKERT